MAFDLEPTDLSFLDGGAQRYVETFDIARPAEDVWAELTSDRPLDWCRVLSISWTSTRPFGVGTTRTAKVFGGAMALDERFIVWEEGRRKTFVGIRLNVPLLRRVLEDYVVEPVDERRCRFTWTIMTEPTAVGRLGGPLNSAVFGSLFRDTRRHYGC